MGLRGVIRSVELRVRKEWSGQDLDWDLNRSKSRVEWRRILCLDYHNETCLVKLDPKGLGDN